MCCPSMRNGPNPDCAAVPGSPLDRRPAGSGRSARPGGPVGRGGYSALNQRTGPARNTPSRAVTPRHDSARPRRTSDRNLGGKSLRVRHRMGPKNSWSPATASGACPSSPNLACLRSPRDRRGPADGGLCRAQSRRAGTRPCADRFQLPDRRRIYFTARRPGRSWNRPPARPGAAAEGLACMACGFRVRVYTREQASPCRVRRLPPMGFRPAAAPPVLDAPVAPQFVPT
jgi:hypothetical protein